MVKRNDNRFSGLKAANYIKPALTLVLAIAGFGLLLASLKSSVTPQAAQATDDISTTWNATGFVNVIGENTNKIGPATIGVTNWHNETSQSGKLIYKEDWSADLPGGSISFGGPLGGAPVIHFPAGYDENRLAANWLFSVNGVNLFDTGPFIITFTGVPAGVSNFHATANNNLQQDFKSFSNSANCSNSGGYCLTPIGSYGFLVFKFSENGAINPAATGLTDFGAMIPTHWTVTGTFLNQ